MTPYFLVRRLLFSSLAAVTLIPRACFAADTLPSLQPAEVPRTVRDLYASFNPDLEPLEVQVVQELEQDGIIVRRLIYTVGTFKGKKSRLGAFYAFPKDHRGKLPAILQMHGGGQRAEAETVVAWAKNGYAALAINWGGRAMAGQEPGEPGTDWGAVDATQTGHNSHYGSCRPDDKTIDTFESPRNNNWFLIVLAARRAVSFLAQQPEVDPEKIGATGHSMGGKLTVMLAGCEPRIKAAAPSCGGVGEAPEELRKRPGNAARPKNESEIYAATIDDSAYLPHITCPIVYLGPQNDFNGLIDELFMNWKRIGSQQVAFAVSKHLNHRHESAAAFVDLLWFESHLKGGLKLPHTPALTVKLNGPEGIPLATLTPDLSQKVDHIEIFYAIDPNGQFRFWRTAEAKRVGDQWLAPCPLLSRDLPLYCLANVHYEFPPIAVEGPPWNKSPGKTFLLSSQLVACEVPELQAAAPHLTDAAERMIEKDFATLQDWYELERLNPEHHQIVTRKVKDPKWRGPDEAILAIDVLDARGGALALQFEFNSYGQYGRDKVSGEFAVELPFAAVPDWQTLQVRLSDLKPLNGEQRLPDNWQTLCSLGIFSRIKLKAPGNEATLGAGRFDSERKLRNLRWVGGSYPQSILMPGGSAKLDPESYQRQFQNQIDQSIELERQDRAP